MRAAVENDPARNIRLWRNAGPQWDVKSVKAERIDERTARISVKAGLPDVGASVTLIYTVHGSGDIIVETSYEPAARSGG
jgi:hypothetical protein